MERPAQSQDLSPIEYVWDYFFRQVAVSSPPHKSLHELEQRLIRALSLLPVEASDNLINSIENRCWQCIAVRNGHIA